MDIKPPIPWVVKNEYCVDLEAVCRIVQVYRLRERFSKLFIVVYKDLGEGPNGRVCRENISGGYDVLKTISTTVSTGLHRKSIIKLRGAVYTIPVRYLTTVITLAPNNQDAFVLQCALLFCPLDELCKRRMTLYDHSRIQLHIKLLADLLYPLGFVLSAAIGEQDKRDPLVFQEV